MIGVSINIVLLLTDATQCKENRVQFLILWLICRLILWSVLLGPAVNCRLYLYDRCGLRNCQLTCKFIQTGCVHNSSWSCFCSSRSIRGNISDHNVTVSCFKKLLSVIGTSKSRYIRPFVSYWIQDMAPLPPFGELKHKNNKKKSYFTPMHIYVQNIKLETLFYIKCYSW